METPRQILDGPVTHPRDLPAFTPEPRRLTTIRSCADQMLVQLVRP
jgi:hypothetical protein